MRLGRPGEGGHYLAAVHIDDVFTLLSQVRAPALVLHHRADRLIPFRGGQ